MLSKYVIPGNKLEIQAVDRSKNMDELESKKVYDSVVYDVLSEDRFEIYMPMEKTKLILLPVDVEYDVYFYTASGLYQCFAKVIDRYKSDGKFILLLELVSNLRKFQRREYYRLSCALDMDTRLLEKEELQAIEKNDKYLVPGLPLKRSIIVDISGGGIRFVGDYAYEIDSMICCKYHLVVDGRDKEYMLVAKIIAVKEVEGRKGLYEHRAKYANIDTYEREEIIRFIFEEERKNRKREKGL
ncbi:MAG: flagellar brake protein [Lachnospiraceae bacterium]|nr:flagellar brake protein [Lachnospiraceae bacterium]